MSLRIRLSRGGGKKHPFYRIVIADSRSPRDGRFIERVGYYNPMVPDDHPQRVVLQQERIRHWLDVGALPSDRVARLIARAGMIGQPQRPEQTKKPLPKKKAQERQKTEAAGTAATLAVSLQENSAS
jgi:small subunit ribosomal protein S16